MKYTADEARSLKKMGELPETAKVNEGALPADEEDDIPFVFDQAAPTDLPSSGEEEGEERSEEEDIYNIDDL